MEFFMFKRYAITYILSSFIIVSVRATIFCFFLAGVGWAVLGEQGRLPGEFMPAVKVLGIAGRGGFSKDRAESVKKIPE